MCKTVLQIAKHLMASQDAQVKINELDAESAYIAWLVMQKSVEEVLDDACNLMPSALHSEVWHLRQGGMEGSII